MTIKAKVPISTGDSKGGKIVIPKGTEGIVKAISNSEAIKKAFPKLSHKIDGWYYICCFPNFTDEILCDKSQLAFQDEVPTPCRGA